MKLLAKEKDIYPIREQYKLCGEILKERRLSPNTCYALELNVTEAVPEWDNQDVCFMMEETIAFTGESTWFCDEYRGQIITIKC